MAVWHAKFKTSVILILKNTSKRYPKRIKIISVNPFNTYTIENLDLKASPIDLVHSSFGRIEELYKISIKHILNSL